MTPQLDTIFGSRSAAQTLLFLQNYGHGHARRIATCFGVSVTGIRRQLERFETNNLLVSRLAGRTRVFEWNPRSATANALREFLETELHRLPPDATQAFFRERQRPRRTGKGL